VRMHRFTRIVARLLGLGDPQRDTAEQIAGGEFANAIRPIANENTRDALRRILPHIFTKSAESALAAMSAIAAVVTASPADDLPWIEEFVRSAWRVSWREPVIVQDLLRSTGKLSADVIGVLSFHPSGFVREAAVKRLGALADGSEVRYLLLRLNDWVPQVREAARLAVLARLRADYVTAFTRNFTLFERAIRAGRVEVATVQDLASVLGTDEGSAAIVAAIKSGTRRSARAVARFVIDRVPTGLPAVVHVGAEADDPVIRMWVTPYVSQVMPCEEASPLLQRLATDSSPVVRRTSLTAFSQSFQHEALASLQQAVVDASASVRQTARFMLRPLKIDFRLVYTSAISSAATSRQLANAIAGLAEVGAAPDAQTAAPYLRHLSARVRRAAVKCVMQLSGPAFVERAFGMLQDVSRRVSAAARDSLRPYTTVLGRAPLEELVAQSPWLHARLNAVHLLPHLGKWESITGLLYATIAADHEVAALAKGYVQAWSRNYNRSQTPPSSRQIDELNSALAKAEGVLDPSAVAEVRFTLRAFST